MLPSRLVAWCGHSSRVCDSFSGHSSVQVEPVFGGLAEGKSQLVVAQIESVTFFYSLTLDSLAVKFDPICTIEVLDEVIATSVDNDAVFSRDVTIANGKVRHLATASNDEPVLV